MTTDEYTLFTLTTKYMRKYQFSEYTTRITDFSKYRKMNTKILLDRSHKYMQNIKHQPSCIGSKKVLNVHINKPRYKNSYTLVR